MNQHQKKYAMNRIEALCEIKLRLAEEKFTSKEIKLADEDAYDLISKGKVKIKPWVVIKTRYNSPDLFPSYDFSKYERASVIDNGKYIPIRDKILGISQKAKDQIMLGDSQEALKIIEELESINI